MRKPANWTAVLTAAGLTLFLAPMAPAQSSSAQSGQRGSSTDRDRDRPGQSGRMGSDHMSDSQSSSSASAQSGNTGNLAAPDRRFVMKAAQGGMAEVKLGELAQQKATNSQVKDFAQKMVNDHNKANDELKDLAQQKGITLPTSMDAKDQALYDRLDKLSGEQFDRAYMRHMTMDHNKDIAEFQHEAQNGKDTAVKQWASQTLPTLKEHDHMARQTMAAMGGSRGTVGGKRGNTSTERGDQGTTGDQNRPMSERPPK